MQSSTIQVIASTTAAALRPAHFAKGEILVSRAWAHRAAKRYRLSYRHATTSTKADEVADGDRVSLPFKHAFEN